MSEPKKGDYELATEAVPVAFQKCKTCQETTTQYGIEISSLNHPTHSECESLRAYACSVCGSLTTKRAPKPPAVVGNDG